jgi:hypothetical protein
MTPLLQPKVLTASSASRACYSLTPEASIVMACLSTGNSQLIKHNQRGGAIQLDGHEETIIVVVSSPSPDQSNSLQRVGILRLRCRLQFPNFPGVKYSRMRNLGIR